MGRRRALYLSSSIGLGHVTRDFAIVAELRRLDPELEIVWLAAPPASDALRAAGEEVVAEASEWRGASGIIERSTSHGRLDVVHYVYRSLPAWAMNARLFRRVIDRYGVDIAIGDEAFEVDVPLVAHVLRVPVPFVMIFDFVGTEAMTGRVHDRVAAWALNALWSLDRFVYARGPHSAVFIGAPEDIPRAPFGWGLPDRRAHALEFYLAVGHVIDFDPDDYGDTLALRRRLGYGDKPLVVCSVGGTSVGRDLLELCAASAGPLRERVPDAQVVLVAGPRIPVESINAHGCEVLGYVPRLCELFAASDVAVVQCGGTTTTELAALGRRFIYAPVEGHFEQEMVARRLERQGIGRRMSVRATTAESLARMIADELGRPGYRTSMPLDGATKAARHILATLERRRGSSEVRA